MFSYLFCSCCLKWPISLCFAKGCAVCSPNIFRNSQLCVRLLLTLYFLRHIKLPYSVGGCCSDLIRHNVTCRKSCFATPSFDDIMAATINYSTCFKSCLCCVGWLYHKEATSPCCTFMHMQESKVGNKRGRYEFPFSSTTYAHTHNIYSFGVASTMEFSLIVMIVFIFRSLLIPAFWAHVCYL